MNVILQIMRKYIYETKWLLAIIILISFIINYLQAKVISQLSAGIIEAVEHGKFGVAFDDAYSYIGISIIYLICIFANDLVEIKVLTRFTQWLRNELFKYVLMSNNEQFTNTNATKYSSPINRVAFAAHSILHNVLNNIITNITFVLVIFAYFVYSDITLGTAFLIGNIITIAYAVMTWTSLMGDKMAYETAVNGNEQYVIDLLNNFDKIIYRGQAKTEYDKYIGRASNTVRLANRFFRHSLFHTTIMNIMLYAIVFGSLLYTIFLCKSGRISKTTFLTFFSIMLLYRDKFFYILNSIPNYMEFQGRIEYALEQFSDLAVDYDTVNSRSYNPIDLAFDRIEFVNVSYRYMENVPLIDNLNLVIEPDNNIVGITGVSGKGKSTIVKLLLKMYPCSSGNIFIDGVSIKDIDPDYLRANITYVNQSAKLFDKKVAENMVYGCSNPAKCDAYLNNILKYPNIQRLYRNVDLDENSGPLGEKLSGGQRQIINIISGLVNPSKILVLDEPTNALDMDLKMELLQIIRDFKSQKKCILVITHDRDVYSIFDETIQV